MNRSRLRGRARQRGAVMVEGIIVAMTLTMFCLGMVYFWRLYAEQMRASSTARSHTLAYALAGCNGDVKAVVKSDESQQAPAPGTAPGMQNGNPPSTGDNKGDSALAEGTKTTNFLSIRHNSSTVTGNVGYGKLLPKAKQDPSSTSVVMCGETPQNGDLKGMISFVIKLFF